MLTTANLKCIQQQTILEPEKQESLMLHRLLDNNISA